MMATEASSAPLPHFDVALGLVSAATLYRGYEDDTLLGVFLPTWQDLRVGSRVTLSIEISPSLDEQLLVTGIVEFARDSQSDSVWPGLGIAFESLTPAQRRILNQFALRRTPVFYDI